MALSSQLVLSQKTENRKKPKTNSQKNKKFTRMILTKKKKKKFGAYLFIHLKTLPLIEIRQERLTVH